MKKKRINLREILTLSIGAVMFIIGLSALIYVCNDTIPNNLKLPAEVWGTVSDWMMILVTIVTAVLLLLTFESQRKVQEDQNLLYELEQKKYLATIKPFFTVAQEEEDYGEGKKQLFVRLTLKEHPAYEINLNVIKREYVEESYGYNNPASLYPDNSFFVVITKDQPTCGTIFLNRVEVFNFTYKDKEGIEYKQIVYLHSGNRWTISGAEKVE